MIVGAGHNGLVAANYLADAGLAVTVVERRGMVGGATVTEELIPGFRSSSCSYVAGLLHPKVLRDLDLAQQGLRLYQTDVGDVNLLEDGRHVVLWNELSATLRDLERLRPGESERFVALGLRLQQFARMIAPWVLEAPPELSEVLATFERAGEADLFEEFFTLSVADLLDRYLELDLLKGFLSFYALVSAWGGPWTPGWSFLYGHHSIGEYEGRMGQYAFPRGGMGSLAEALASRARARGVAIRVDAPVERILVERGRATGVLLASGEELPARSVASGADPHRTFLGLVERGDLPARFRTDIEHFDMRGSMARVHIALDGLPDFVGMESGAGPHYRGLTLLGADMERFERAWDAERQGRIPEDFPVEFLTQSVHDDTIAPAGKHLLITGVQQLPYELADGTWDDHKAAFTERVIEVMTRYAPRLRDHIIDTYTITPLDLEREYGLTGGNIFHGAMTLGQVFGGRPASGFGGYRSPIEGLYLCGAGAHPGGGVMGVPGHNAAHVIASDLLGITGHGRNGAAPAAGGADRGPLIERVMARPRPRKALVWLARQPALSPLVERLSRRRAEPARRP
ncbi:MAG TPA: NAD(P)/FAD-dependent oxidoreductase [Thermoleophilaceae bacterium]